MPSRATIRFVLQVQRAGDPELPREFVDTSIDPAFNRTPDFALTDNDLLQLALNQAQPGDLIEIDPDTTQGGSVLP